MYTVPGTYTAVRALCLQGNELEHLLSEYIPVELTFSNLSSNWIRRLNRNTLGFNRRPRRDAQRVRVLLSPGCRLSEDGRGNGAGATVLARPDYLLQIYLFHLS